MHELSRTGHGRWLLLGAATFAFAALRAAPVSAQTLIVDGSGTLGAATFDIGSATQRRYDHVCVINGGLVTVDPYMGGDKAVQGNLELIAGSVYVDATSKISARGAGYQGRTCDAGDGPTLTSGGRGGCSVADSGGGGAHFGNGGRGTVDAPVAFPVSFEDACTSTWTGSTCSSFADCGTPMMSCPDGRGGRFCEIGPSVAGLGFWHNIFEPEFGAAGGDKGCRDNNAFSPMTAGAGGGRVVLVGLHDLTSVKTSPCGIGLSRGQVEVDGQIDANGKRGCGIGNDSAGGGAGGTVLIVGEQVTIGASAVISAKGGRGGDTFAAASGQPDYRDCIAGAQTGGTCDDCGGGGGGGVINVQSVTSNIDPAANFDVGGALGGVCTVCTGEAGGGAGELQIDSAYVGEICDGYDNDFDGTIDEGLGSVDCGLGTCTTPIPACQNGAPVSCTPTTGSDRTCKADPAGAKPRVAVILDTSASMLLTLSGYPTFGDGSVEHPGLDLNGDTLSNDSRLFLARESLGQVMSAYPEIEFSLARYHQDQAKDRNCQTAAWYECKGLVASYDNPVGNTGPKVCDVAIGPSTKIAVNQLPQSPEECINYAGSCGGPRRGADVLAGFGMPVRDIVRWLDGRETNFVNTTTVGDYCDHSKGGDCEVRGSGPTPLAGSLEAIQDYLGPIRATDPATSCRGYSVILVTDGAESCNGDPAAAAQSLHDAFGVEVYVIAVSVLPTEQASLNAIASAGSGGARPTATFVSQPQDLVPALSTIIAGSIHSEKCNGMDDDCDGKIDEDFPGLGSACSDTNKGVCKGTGSLVCNGTQNGTTCDITMPGTTSSTEICNLLDDDCDGATDEGLTCSVPACTGTGSEICNGADDDCDGKVDEADPAIGHSCGSSKGECLPGKTRCVAGVLRCVGGKGPGSEICNGADDNCNGKIDDNATCPPQRACIDGACRRACDPTAEFPCPVGFACAVSPPLPGHYCLATACAQCTIDQKCVNDVCEDLCAHVTCGAHEQCVAGDCRDCHTLGCPSGKVCYASQCLDDPCSGVTCKKDELCDNGACRVLCDDAQCGEGKHCNDQGACVTNPCAGISCADGLFCDAGKCRDNPCVSMSCATGDVCVPAVACIDDPCPRVKCPSDWRCKAGSSGEAVCVSATSGGALGGGGASGANGKLVSATGGGGFGCSVTAPGERSSSGSSGSSGVQLASVLGLLLLSGSRRRRS